MTRLCVCSPQRGAHQRLFIASFLLLFIFTHAWTTPNPFRIQRTSLAVSQAIVHDASTAGKKEPELALSPLSLTMDELGRELGGRGRAQSCWDCYREGIDPLWYFGNESDVEDAGILGDGWTHSQLQQVMSGRRTDHGLGKKSLDILERKFGTIEDKVASLSKISVSQDGTTKLLLKLVADGLEVETVIIPWSDKEKSTLCVSSQIGCKQACTFCMTGRMGKLRSLSADEILAQLYWANKACRVRNICPIDNVVFMGMGEPADNVGPVVQSANIMVDPILFQLAPRRVTISTVAPTPDSFEELGKASVVLAWSVHASRDQVRQELVPTTKHSVEELRDGLSRTLQQRTKRLRNTMLEITMLDNINDSEEDALHLVEFCKPLLDQVQGIKLVVNLIPWNDIGAQFGPASEYRKPSMSRVLAFQKILVDNSILCYVRTTRGDDESAACGMLATKKKNSQ
jgi:23S rRNA (adenine2503-C2)-methyltransferase